MPNHSLPGRTKSKSAKAVAVEKLRKYAPRHSDAMEVLAEQFPGNGALHDILYPRVSDLILYQNPGYAQRYLNTVKVVHQAEISQLSAGMNQSDESLFTATVAKWLFKLMAYKDEYEVARCGHRPLQWKMQKRAIKATSKSPSISILPYFVSWV